jgi:hypothetical protein
MRTVPSTAVSRVASSRSAREIAVSVATRWFGRSKDGTGERSVDRGQAVACPDRVEVIPMGEARLWPALAVAAFCGAAVGTEREWSGHAEGEHAHFGGLRAAAFHHGTANDVDAQGARRTSRPNRRRRRYRAASKPAPVPPVSSYRRRTSFRAERREFHCPLHRGETEGAT